MRYANWVSDRAPARSWQAVGGMYVAVVLGHVTEEDDGGDMTGTQGTRAGTSVPSG